MDDQAAEFVGKRPCQMGHVELDEVAEGYGSGLIIELGDEWTTILDVDDAEWLIARLAAWIAHRRALAAPKEPEG